MNWKELWIKAERMMGESGIAAFERTELMIGIFDDRNFQDDCRSRRVNAEDELDRLCDDLNLNFLELSEMRKYYPKKEQWAKGRLRQMYDKMVADIRKSQPVVKKERTPEVERLRQQLAAAHDQIQAYRKELSHVKSENSRLKKEIDKIKSILS